MTSTSVACEVLKTTCTAIPLMFLHTPHLIISLRVHPRMHIMGSYKRYQLLAQWAPRSSELADPIRSHVNALLLLLFL